MLLFMPSHHSEQVLVRNLGFLSVWCAGDRQPNLDNDISERLKVLSMPRLEGNPKSAQSQRWPTLEL